MRVICEKCRSAYAIDDAQVPPAGARTQCPRCSHVQIARPLSKGSGASAKVVAISEAEHESRQKSPPTAREDSAAWDEVVAAAGGKPSPAANPGPAKPPPP